MGYIVPQLCLQKERAFLPMKPAEGKAEPRDEEQDLILIISCQHLDPSMPEARYSWIFKLHKPTNSLFILRTRFQSPAMKES